MTGHTGGWLIAGSFTYIKNDLKLLLKKLSMETYTALKSIFMLSVIGIIISLTTLYLHYEPVSPKGICEAGDWFSCSTVNKSVYSKLFGVPVSLIGLGGYLSLLILSFLTIVGADISGRNHSIIFAGSVIGVAFTAYLSYMELFVLHAICIFCIGSAAVIFSIFYSAKSMKP